MFGGTRQHPDTLAPRISPSRSWQSGCLHVPCSWMTREAITYLPPKLLALFIASVLKKTNISVTKTRKTLTCRAMICPWQSLVKWRQLQINSDKLPLSPLLPKFPSRPQQGTDYASVWDFALELHLVDGWSKAVGNNKWNSDKGRSFLSL